MTTAQLPPDEPERLRSLRALGLLDTPAEERFDRITRLAQALFDVPIVLVSLVDADRQWFKSRQGLDAAETAREISFCAHAIRGDELFIVPDATRDERFSDNSLVVGEPLIRFYAGAPLAAPDGHKIGTLCLIDRRPRELTSQQRTALRDLADLVQGEIARTAARRAVPQEISLQRKATQLKVLAGFGAALAALAVVSMLSYRVSRQFVGAGADRLATLQIVGGVVRALVVILALLALLRDIAAREKVEDELRRTRDEALGEAEGRRVAQAEAEKLGERLGAVLDHIDIGVLMVELDGTMSIYNMAAERIHGAWREQMERLKRAGTHPAMLEDEKTVIAVGETPLGRALKGQTVRDAHIFFRTPFRPNGYHLRVSAVPLRDHRGLMAGAVLMFSERRR
jgi:PAS domain-containing protein